MVTAIFFLSIAFLTAKSIPEGQHSITSLLGAASALSDCNPMHKLQW